MQSVYLCLAYGEKKKKTQLWSLSLRFNLFAYSVFLSPQFRLHFFVCLISYLFPYLYFLVFIYFQQRSIVAWYVFGAWLLVNMRMLPVCSATPSYSLSSQVKFKYFNLNILYALLLLGDWFNGQVFSWMNWKNSISLPELLKRNTMVKNVTEFPVLVWYGLQLLVGKEKAKIKAWWDFIPIGVSFSWINLGWKGHWSVTGNTFYSLSMCSEMCSWMNTWNLTVWFCQWNWNM